MEKELKFVIGANFGDEGKGLMTDYFCHQSLLNGRRTLVVLCNGGSQRGHTVCLKDGIRHVFHHMSSGTLSGADTLFTKDFILNPMVFNQERLELPMKCLMFASSKCRVSTPYDMIYNQVVESILGENKHGSCGVGIFSTINRYKDSEYQEYAYSEMINLMHRNKLEPYIQNIQFYYEKLLKRQFGINIAEYCKDKLGIDWNSSGILYHYLDDFSIMSNIIFPLYGDEETTIFDDYDSVVVELGQGLLLDQNNKKYFPNLTPSNTGFFRNINSLRCILPEYFLKNIEACYVTRTYLTRHGNGHLDNECDKEELSDKIEDLTNIPNEHQGTIRYAPIDYDDVLRRIRSDSICGLDVSVSIAITHNDQLNISDDELLKISGSVENVYISNGSTTQDVKKIK